MISLTFVEFLLVAVALVSFGAFLRRAFDWLLADAECDWSRYPYEFEERPALRLVHASEFPFDWRIEGDL